MNKKEQARQRKADLSYFAAVAYPDAAYPELRTTFDLCLWVWFSLVKRFTSTLLLTFGSLSPSMMVGPQIK